jgi:proline iminopeptidase
MLSEHAAALAPGAHDLDVDGITQRYHVAGTGPVCVVHPGGPGVDWAYLRLPELERTATVVYLEPVGTGGSGRLPGRAAYRLAAYSRFLHAVVEHLGRPQVALLGHSHGGLVAQRYALDHPGRVARLVLYATTPCTGSEWEADAERNQRQLAAEQASQPEMASITAALDTPGAADGDAARTAFLRKIMPLYFADYWGREREFRPAREQLRVYGVPRAAAEDLRGELGRITAPTLIIGGARDFCCGPRWGQILHESIAGSRLVMDPASGHFGHLEQAARFYAEVAGFLRPLSGRGDLPELRQRIPGELLKRGPARVVDPLLEGDVHDGRARVGGEGGGGVAEAAGAQRPGHGGGQ